MRRFAFVDPDGNPHVDTTRPADVAPESRLWIWHPRDAPFRKSCILQSIAETSATAQRHGPAFARLYQMVAADAATQPST